MIKIAPSLLSADFFNLKEDLGNIPNADLLHVDVMDGHFVPNMTIGIPVIQSLAKGCALPLDVHLMIEKPRLLLEAFCQCKPASLTIHVEADNQEGIREAIDMMKKHHIAVGLALKPNTKASAVLPFIQDLDMILVMTVEPGFGGQSFMKTQLETIAQVKEYCKAHKPDCLIQVDGGINEETAPWVIEAGATVLVAGTAVFGKESPADAIEALRKGNGHV